MKQILTIIFLLIYADASAQTGVLMNRYYISGSLSVGQQQRAFADSNAWLQIGPDTTNKGVLLPRVILDSVSTSQRALFVYDLQDSVLYHFDGADKVRYMTYKDTSFIKQLILTQIPDHSNYFIKGGNSFGGTTGVGTSDNNHLDVKTNNSTRLRVTNDGNVLIGGTTNTGYDLDVNGAIHCDSLVRMDVVNPSNTEKDFLSVQGSFHTASKFNIGLYNYGAYVKSHTIDLKTSGNSNPILHLEGIPPSAGGVYINGTQEIIDLRGGLLGTGWKLFAPRGIWSYQHTSSPFQPIEFTGAPNGSTNQGIKLNTYSFPNALQIFGLSGNVAIGGINTDNGHDLEVEGELYSDSIAAEDRILVKNLSATSGLKAGDHTASVADYYAFELSNPGSYETKITLRPSANASGFNSAYWTGISNTGYATLINCGTYHDLIFKRGSMELGRFSQSNSLLLGRDTHDGFKLDVNGNARVSAEMQLEGGLVFRQSNKTINITEGNTASQPVSINIGRTNVLNTNDNGRHITIGNSNTGNTTKIWQYMIGQGNNLSTAQFSATAFGDYNTIAFADTYQFIYGSNNTINYPSSSTSRGQFIIGSYNSVLHKYSSVLGNNQATTADNQLIIAEGNANSVGGGYRDVYFGSGPVSTLSGGLGAPVTIHASGANGTDKQGGLLRLAAGKSTGAAVPPDVIIATATSAASGIGQQTLSDRWYVKGENGSLSNNSNPTALLDVGAVTGYDQLRIRTSYTPSSSSDTNGSIGDVAWDDDYIYIKTGAGWKRTALSTF